VAAVVQALSWDELTSLTAPWAFVVVCAADELGVIGGEAPAEAQVWLLRGDRCRDRDSLFTELVRELEFPAYFGKNWGSVTDCLHDLEWVPASSYTLIITDAAEVLATSDDDFARLLDVLRGAHTFWRSTDEANPFLDTRPLPLHAVLHADPDSADALRGRLARVNFDAPERELTRVAPA
jgi:hypothetical protein